MIETSRTKPADDRVRLRRFHERGSYEREAILRILDDGVMCHVAFVHGDQPVVIPTLYWHDDDRIYFHGSTASRMVRAALAGPVCVSVTHLDGLVLTRSAFHHSANYRSVVIMGRPQAVDGQEAETQLRCMMERMFPDRWNQLRPVTPQEIKATRVLSLSLDTASAKVRTGPPGEDEGDLQWPVWAGVVPIRTTALDPIADPSGAGADLPAAKCSLFRS